MLLHGAPPVAAHAAGHFGMQRRMIMSIVVVLGAQTRRRAASAPWQVSLQKQLQVREGEGPGAAVVGTRCDPA